MSTEKPLVDQHYRLEKFPGKGGWTYTELPNLAPASGNPFGWLRVRGSIDGFPIAAYHLMPMGNGRLFLPVKAQIRKKIGKGAGDSVHVLLFVDDSPVRIPEELQQCLADEPAALKKFMERSESEKKRAIDHIYASRREETRVHRIAALINELMQ